MTDTLVRTYATREKRDRNHLDLESIQALNNAMIDFNGTILFSSNDQELTQSVANRIIEITPNQNYDKLMTYQEYIEFKKNIQP